MFLNVRGFKVTNIKFGTTTYSDKNTQPSKELQNVINTCLAQLNSDKALMSTINAELAKLGINKYPGLNSFDVKQTVLDIEPRLVGKNGVVEVP